MIPKLVYQMSKEQESAILDYFTAGKKVNSLRKLAEVLECSVQGADNIAFRVIGQWLRNGKIKPSNEFFNK